MDGFNRNPCDIIAVKMKIPAFGFERWITTDLTV